MRREPVPRGLTQPTLTGLLARMDDDRERAGVAYEALRHALVRFFDWRGLSFPDACADETIDRLARRLADGEAIVDLKGYALGIARLVWLEHSRAPDGRMASLDEVAALHVTAPSPPEPELPLAQCFDRCLDSLPAEGRQLILQYYTHEPRGQIAARAMMARSLTLSPNALRSRAQRLRDRLERCVRECLGTTRNGRADHHLV